MSDGKRYGCRFGTACCGDNFPVHERGDLLNFQGREHNLGRSKEVGGGKSRRRGLLLLRPQDGLELAILDV